MLFCDALPRNGRTPAQGRPVHRCAIILARRRQAQILYRRSSLRRPADTRGTDVPTEAPMTILLRVLARSGCALAFVAAPVLAAEPLINVLTSSVYYPLGV